MRSPFGYFEHRVIGWTSTPQAIKDEGDHYIHLTGLSSKEFDVVGYLYSRLNIIDIKAASILTVNTLSLGITSLVLATTSSQAGDPQRLGAELLVPAVAMVASSIIAILLALAIARLKFDHITALRDIEKYKRTFFEITIARQRILAAARGFTALSFSLYALLLLLKLFRVGDP